MHRHLSFRTGCQRRAIRRASAILLALSTGGSAVRAQSAAQADTGDFRVGDRIALTVRSENALLPDSALSDTFPVRDGTTLELPSLPPIALAGVRRSALQPYLTKEIGRYVRNPSVRATALVRVGVLGQVARPGYYAVAADTPVNDVIMVAGGPTGTADLNRTTINRGTRQVGKKEKVRVALTQGTTLEQLHFRSGDELVIAEKAKSRLESTLRIISLVSAAGLAVYYLARIR